MSWGADGIRICRDSFFATHGDRQMLIAGSRVRAADS